MVDDLRTTLEQEKAQLIARLTDLDTEADPAAFDDNFADNAQVSAEHDENRSLAEALRAQLRHVEAALTGLANGTYGHCEVCKSEIGSARLEALPWAVRCIDHA